MIDVATLRILLLEDSLMDAELIDAHLRKMPRSVELLVATGRHAFVGHMAGSRFDLILSDYALPDFDGLTALRIVRSLDPIVPFVFISGVLGEERAVEALRDGATDYVLKRNLARLPGVVERALVEAEGNRQRLEAEGKLRDLAETLERRVEERTAELAARRVAECGSSRQSA